MKGYIDSIDTMGMVDGPGVRLVVFMQGCKLRCIFCHNPETWEFKKDNSITSNELLKKIKNNFSYYKNGGITFSGGEPLNQPDFLIDALKKLKEFGCHTALDTAGCGCGQYEEILKYTDLVLLDVKACNPEMYKRITGANMDEVNKFIEALNKSGKEVWIRQVIIPGINDTKEYIDEFKEYIKGIKHITNIELLPYHLYGVEKYKKLNIRYKLAGVPAMTEEKVQELRDYLNENKTEE